MFLCPCSQWVCNCSLYFCSLHNSVYYPVSTDLSLQPPTITPSLRSVCNISATFSYTLSVCYDPDTIATLPAADSHTVAGYHTDTLRTVLAVLSIYLYLYSSDCCSSGQAIPVHRLLQMCQLTLNLRVHCSLIYQDV